MSPETLTESIDKARYEAPSPVVEGEAESRLQIGGQGPMQPARRSGATGGVSSSIGSPFAERAAAFIDTMNAPLAARLRSALSRGLKPSLQGAA